MILLTSHHLKHFLKKSRSLRFLSAWAGMFLTGCASGLNLPSTPDSGTSTATNPAAIQAKLADAAVGARVDFTTSNFFTLTSPHSEFQCAGDAKKYLDPLALLQDLPAPFPNNFLDSSVTIQPSFIKNVSVDLSNSNNTVDYPKNAAFGCSYGSLQSVQPKNCAIFDSTENSQITVNGYLSGYYSTFDSGCLGAGPIVSSDPTLSKQSVGGVFFDLDRSKLGAEENLLLHLTFLPLGPQNLVPDVGNSSSTLVQGNVGEAAVLRVHLSRTGQKASALRGAFQPRSLTYADPEVYPVLANSLMTFPPPYGQIREEQILIPLSLDSSIDRIRVERLTGSMIFISAKLQRLGTH